MQVYFSHHSEKVLNMDFADNVIHKPDAEEVTPTGAIIFKDGSQVQVDSIVYCTGRF